MKEDDLQPRISAKAHSWSSVKLNWSHFQIYKALKSFMYIFFLRKQPHGEGGKGNEEDLAYKEKGSQQTGWQKEFPRKWQTEVPECEPSSILDLNDNIGCPRNEVSSLKVLLLINRQ